MHRSNQRPLNQYEPRQCGRKLRWQLTAALTMVGMLRVGVARANDENPLQAAQPRVTSEAWAAELTEQGLALYKARNYRLATERFLQAYAIEPDPNLLFNVARCYQALGDSAAAIEKYEAYLRSPSIDPSGRERAEKSLRGLRDGGERKPAAAARPTSSSPNPEMSPPGGRDKVESTELDAIRSTAERVDERRPGADGTRATVGWVVTAVLATGTAVTGFLAYDNAQELAQARATFPGDPVQIDHLASNTAVLSVTADALGIATAVSAALAVYWTVARPSARNEVKTALGVSGIKLSGSF